MEPEEEKGDDDCRHDGHGEPTLAAADPVPDWLAVEIGQPEEEGDHEDRADRVDDQKAQIRSAQNSGSEIDRRTKADQKALRAGSSSSHVCGSNVFDFLLAANWGVKTLIQRG